MIRSLCLLCLVAPAAAGSESERAWIPLEGVAAVVNDDIVKRSELLREAQAIRERAQVPISTEEDREAFREEVRRHLVLERLRSQAGRTLGIEEEQVDRIVDRHLEDLRGRVGLLPYVEDLESRGLDATDEHDRTRRQLYGQSWESRVTGDDFTPKRPSRDRFVRPGEMHFIYRAVPELFAPPPDVVLQQLSLRVRDDETLEETVQRAEALRERVRAGEPLDSLAAELGVDQASLRTQRAPLDRLVSGLREYAARTEPGIPSPVVPVSGGPGEPPQVVFFLLTERRQVGSPRPFLDGDVQAALAERQLESRDRWLLAKSQSDLVERSYIQPALEPPEGGGTVPGPDGVPVPVGGPADEAPAPDAGIPVPDLPAPLPAGDAAESDGEPAEAEADAEGRAAGSDLEPTEEPGEPGGQPSPEVPEDEPAAPVPVPEAVADGAGA